MKIPRWIAGLSLLVAMTISSHTHAQAVRESPYYYAVPSGGAVKVAAYATMNPDCSIVGPVTANLIQAPRGGQVSIGEERLFPNFITLNPRSVCDKHRVPETVIRYQSAPGFVGADQFTIEVLFPGNVAKTVSFTVNVRPSTQVVSSSPNDAGAPKQHAICSNERSLASLSSAVPVSISFVNHAREPRTIYWLDFHGARVKYRTLDGGQRLNLNTYLTHPWVIADDRDNCLEVVLPKPAGTTISIR